MADRPYETRTVTAQLELRDADTEPVLDGIASTFNDPYRVGFFREQLATGAFTRTLAGGPDVRLLVDHEGQPLARTKSGTLTLSEVQQGLHALAPLDKSDPDVQRLIPKMRRGDLDEMSFGFRVPAAGDEWDYSEEVPLRTLREVDLRGGDVSVVTYPANSNTSVSLRADSDRGSAYTLAAAMLREIRDGRGFDRTNMGHLGEALRSMGVSFNIAMSAVCTDPDDDMEPDPGDPGEGMEPPEANGLPTDLAKRVAQALALRALRA